MEIHLKNIAVFTRKNSSGMTLIGVILVMIILGLLVGMGAGLLNPLTKKVKLQEIRSAVAEAHNAIIGYAAINKRLPAGLSAIGVRTYDSYGNDLIYYAAGGITGADLCTTQGAYLTVSDKGTNKTNVAFIVFSEGPNYCNQTGTASPFTISGTGTTVACPQNANAGYDDTVMYKEITSLREELCNRFRIVSVDLPKGREEVPYPSTVLEATDGPLPYTWSIAGQSQGTNGCAGSAYPIASTNTGLCMSTGGLISGTPIADNSYNITVSVTDAEGRAATKNLSITVNPNDPRITTEFLHNSYISMGYSAVIAATGGTGSYSSSIISGSLPPGLSLAGNTISGTPTAAGTYTFTVQITDGRGRQREKTLVLRTQ